VHFSVRLPTDAQSVPLVRGLLRQALQYLEVAEHGIQEIVLALTEACANVVQHERSPLDPGRGLILMRALVDRLDFVLDEDGRHRVTLEKRLDVSPKLRLLPI
jgi:serine/threonine-protein kinase RsbW